MVGECQAGKLRDKAKLIPSRHITSKPRRINVEATSRRRLDVDMALFKVCVHAGSLYRTVLIV